MSRWTPCLCVLATSLASAQTVTLQDAPDGGYSGTRDVRLSDGAGTFWQQTSNYGGSTTLSAVGGTYRNGVLMKWDLSILPPTTDVYTSTLFLRITSSASSGHELYEMNRAWVEGQATWNIWRTGSTWATAGALGGADRGNTALGTVIGSSGNTASIALNAAGIAVVQGWLTNPATNEGFLVQDYNNTDGISWHSSERSVASERPRLRIVFDGGTLDFQNGVSPSTTYFGNIDTTIANGPDPKTRNNNGSGLQMGFTSSSLISFDVAQIPAGSIVESVALEVNVSDAFGTFPLYEALQPWSETAATWNRFDGMNNWADAGANGPADHGPTVLALFDAGTVTNARVAVALNADGVDLVQRWVDGVTAPRGFVITQPGSTDFVALRDREYSVVAERPALIVTYSPNDGGFVRSDAGTSNALTVGCGCSQSGAAPFALLLMLVMARRRWGISPS